MKCLLLTCLSLPAVAADLTIYNQAFGVVRDVVPLDLKAGLNEAPFAGVTAQVEADSVVLRDPTGKANWQIIEQSYRNDAVSEPLLLSLFEGQTIDFVQQEPQKPDRVARGKIVRSGYVPGGENVEPIIELDGKLVFQLPGRPHFPALGADTILKPTLVWKLNAPAAVKLDAELVYVTGGFTWQASYNLVASEKTDTVDLVGWVTIKNESGTGFPQARIKLMAGDVNKVVPVRPMLQNNREVMYAAAPAAPEPVVTEKAFDEFHLYTLANPTTLRDKETKQVEFARAAGVKAERIYVYDGAMLDGWNPGFDAGGDPGYGATSNKKVAVYREFTNSQANKLGIPLPKGRVRFYTQDGADGSIQFVGENELDHTPKDELVRLFVGNSFDLVGERSRQDFSMNEANHRADESFEIKVRNRKKEPVTIRVVEHLYRWAKWEIVEKSQDFTKRDARTIEFRVALKPDEEKVISYRVRYSW